MSQNTVLIIQARMGSTRLPGKSMMDLAGAPMVGRILERVKRCMSINSIVLAIPDTNEDRILATLGESYGVNVFAGSEGDLVARYYGAAKWSKAELVVRLPADNATPEPEEIDRIVHFHKSLKVPGFSSNLSNIGDSGYPDGIGAEIFNFNLLEEVYFNQVNVNMREHVHLNFFDYSSGRAVDSVWCPVNTVKCPEKIRRPELVLDVNTAEQYEFMRQLYEYLYPRNSKFHICDTIKWYDSVFKKNL